MKVEYDAYTHMFTYVYTYRHFLYLFNAKEPLFPVCVIWGPFLHNECFQTQHRLQFPLKCPILPSWKICFILRLFFSCFALRASQLKSVPNPPICSDSCLVAWFCGTPVFLGSRSLTPIVSLQVLLMFCPLGLPLRGADWSRIERTVLLSHLRQILFGHQCCCWFCGMDVLCFSVNPQVSF